jgi:2-polyprenyl-3-methyl-5-hydroxy-6-metoxy-1,4-benzoquinol methylase
MGDDLGNVADPPEQLVQALQDRYGVGENFVRAYLRQGQADKPGTYPSLEELQRMQPPYSVWFEYSMTTNRRAEQSWQEIAPWLPPNARRYLDIGCGTGGCLVAAHRRGLEVRGIEIDPSRIALGEANCLDVGLQGCIQQADILDEAQVSQLGKFDVITMLSVLEHVLDVPKTLENVTRMLNPGGILFMEIPNRECLSFVGADPHYNLFGITLLEPVDAMAYQKIFITTEYEVGDYYPLSFYLQRLERAGCENHLLLTQRYALQRLVLSPLLFGRLGLRYIRYLRRTLPKLDSDLAATIKVKSWDYLKGFVKNLFDRPWRTLDHDRLVVRHLLNVWVVVARKRTLE